MTDKSVAETAMAGDKTEQTIRLMIADDQPLIRRGLAMMLGAEPDIEIVATVEDGQQAIDVALKQRPDVIIMDLQMPGTSGVDAIRAGAQAYLLKDATEKEVLATVKAVHRGESHLSPSIARKVMSQFRTLAQNSTESAAAKKAAVVPTSNSIQSEITEPDLTPPGLTPDEPLTSKEKQVLSLLAQGKSNKQIAAEIHLAEGTVKNYVSRIMEKLHAQSRTELAVRAVSGR
jgi:DNA-binding NarL/FixJ family response regulator